MTIAAMTGHLLPSASLLAYLILLDSLAISLAHAIVPTGEGTFDPIHRVADVSSRKIYVRHG
jgi:hypothetical protein